MGNVTFSMNYFCTVSSSLNFQKNFERDTFLSVVPWPLLSCHDALVDHLQLRFPIAAILCYTAITVASYQGPLYWNTSISLRQFVLWFAFTSCCQHFNCRLLPRYYFKTQFIFPQSFVSLWHEMLFVRLVPRLFYNKKDWMQSRGHNTRLFNRKLQYSQITWNGSGTILGL